MPYDGYDELGRWRDVADCAFAPVDAGATISQRAPARGRVATEVYVERRDSSGGEKN